MSPKTPLEARNTPSYYDRSSEQRHQDALVEYFSMTVLAVQLAVDAKKAKKSGAFGTGQAVKVPELYREASSFMSLDRIVYPCKLACT